MNQSNYSVPSFGCLLASLPMEFRSQKVKDQLQRAYDVEFKRINEYVDRLNAEQKDFSAVLYFFRKGGRGQWLAEFAVNDLSIPRANSYNWHCQNVSQWVYAGCILFDEGRFKDDAEYVISTHH